MFKYGKIIANIITKGGVIIISIKSKRKKRGLSQLALAKRLGITQGAVSQWETGISTPSIVLLPKLASVLQCKIDDLLEDLAKEEAN